ncbi:MAG: leucine-rich repeat domain-containing protein, partial [Candidatus Coproplasma sp.]
MNRKDVVKKEKYLYPREEKLVYVTDYVVLEENGKRYAVLRFFNSRNEVLDELHVKFVQLDSAGKKLSSKRLRLNNLNGAAGSVFVPEQKLELSSECYDFKIEVISAVYGDYAYSAANGDVRVDFNGDKNQCDLSAVKSKLGGKKLSVRYRKMGFSALLCLCSVVLIAAVVTFTILHINRFKEQEITFSQDRVEYTFIDGDKSENGKLSVTGYGGAAQNITIPAEIGGYPVIEIAPRAFSNNTRIKSVSIEGSVSVGDEAFSNCINLSSFDFSDVYVVGDGAFRNCISLYELQSSSLGYIGEESFAGCSSLNRVVLGYVGGSDKITIGGNAFANCDALTEIEVDSYIIYEGNSGIFSKCSNVSSLKLKSLGTVNGAVPKISELFNAEAAYLKLQSLEIDEVESIGYGMCSGLANLQTFKVNSNSSS